MSELKETRIDVGDFKTQCYRLIYALDGAKVVITRYGKPVAVMIGVDELEGLEATIAVLEDSTGVLRRSIKDIQPDRLHDHDDVVRELG